MFLRKVLLHEKLVSVFTHSGFFLRPKYLKMGIYTVESEAMAIVKPTLKPLNFTKQSLGSVHTKVAF